MINNRVKQIKIDWKNNPDHDEEKVTYKLFTHSKKATKLLLSESDLKMLKPQDKKRCVIL